MSPWSGSNIVTVSVGPDRPVARLVCTRGVPMKIKFVVVTSLLKAPTSETAAKRLLRKPNNGLFVIKRGSSGLTRRFVFA